jgi:hypothetical protein
MFDSLFVMLETVVSERIQPLADAQLGARTTVLQASLVHAAPQEHAIR